MNDSESDIIEDKQDFIIPKSTKDMRACQECGFILTQDQWNKIKQCPNECNATQTKLFQGIVCIMRPSKSWVVKKLGKTRNTNPGLYAIEVQAD